MVIDKQAQPGSSKKASPSAISTRVVKFLYSLVKIIVTHGEDDGKRRFKKG